MGLLGRGVSGPPAPIRYVPGDLGYERPAAIQFSLGATDPERRRLMGWLAGEDPVRAEMKIRPVLRCWRRRLGRSSDPWLATLPRLVSRIRPGPR